MRTNLYSKIAKLGGVLAIAMASATQIQSAYAVSVSYTLELTEVSSTILTYTYSNALDPTPFTITQGIGGGSTPDSWTVSIDPTSGITLNSGFVFDFAEGPGEPSNELNRVQGGSGTPFNNRLFVNSDLAIGTSGIVTSANIGTDDGVPIILKFVDLAAASETSNSTPDGGSTCILLAGCLAGMVRLRRVFVRA